MSKKQRILWRASILFALLFAAAPTANAMHIMEGYLSVSYCIAWGAISLPFLAAGIFSIQKRVKNDRKSMTLIAMAGAFIFVISALKIPSVTGSCSHMTGTGLGAILFGPAAVSILGMIVLLFQAILLAHGGITTLGANVFSMAVAGPLIAFGIFRICGIGKVNRKVSVFLAAFFGDIVTYCVTSAQLGMAYPSESGGIAASTIKFLGVFAPTQLTLAILEGILTVLIVIALETYARPELKSIGYLKERKEYE